MRVRAVFATRKYTPDEPELVVAWDEYSIDSNPDGWTEAVKHGLDSWGEDLHAYRIVEFRVDYPALLASFEIPVIPVLGMEEVGPGFGGAPAGSMPPGM